MKRTLIAVLMLTVTIAAFAAPPGPRGDGPRGDGPQRGGRALLPPKALADFLDLSESQQASLDALRDTLKSSVEPLREQQRANREALRAAVEAGDAAKAGELSIALHNTRKQFKAARESFETSLVALLTPEQKAKWETYREIAGSRGRRGRRS
jgi:Spy/CpxP family protein refolding chaperone